MYVNCVTSKVFKTTTVLAMLKACGILFYLTLSACSKLPTPTETVNTSLAQPTFSGLTANSYLTTYTPYVVSGECNTAVPDLDYSFNNTTWSALAGGCPGNGLFSVSVPVSSATPSYLYVRSRADTKFSSTSIATVTKSVPPATSVFGFAQSSKADGIGNNKTQNVMNLSFDDGPTAGVSSANHTVQNGLIGATYAQ